MYLSLLVPNKMKTLIFFSFWSKPVKLPICCCTPSSGPFPLLQLRILFAGEGRSQVTILHPGEHVLYEAFFSSKLHCWAIGAVQLVALIQIWVTLARLIKSAISRLSITPRTLPCKCGRREPTPQSCRLHSVHVGPSTYARTYVHTHIHNNKKNACYVQWS